jgi:hypothetical protein
MRININWVMGYLRTHGQSAAHGLIYSLCRHVKRESLAVNNHLIITNECPFPALRIRSLEEVLHNLRFWLPKVGGIISELPLYFDSIKIIPEGRLSGYAESLMHEKETFFVFNSSMPSDGFADYLTEKGFNTVSMPMAEEASYKARKIVFIKGVEKPLFIEAPAGLICVAPAFGVYEIGGKRDEISSTPGVVRQDGSTDKALTIYTTAESLFSRLPQDDWDNVILPTLLSNPNIHWVFVAPIRPHRDLANELSYGMNGLKRLGLLNGDAPRVRVIEKHVENLFDVLETDADIFYKGFHRGGGTTVAGAIHRQVPVVDYTFADSNVFLDKTLLQTDQKSARKQLQELINSSAERSNVAKLQHESLLISNKMKAKYFLATLSRFAAGGNRAQY